MLLKSMRISTGDIVVIEITKGTHEEHIIKMLQKTYPITTKDMAKELHLSKTMVERVLHQLQTQGIVQLEPLPDKTFVRLLRNDFKFVGKQRQRKFIKHSSGKKPFKPKDYDGMMYS